MSDNIQRRTFSFNAVIVISILCLLFGTISGAIASYIVKGDLFSSNKKSNTDTNTIQNGKPNISFLNFKKNLNTQLLYHVQLVYLSSKDLIENNIQYNTTSKLLEDNTISLSKIFSGIYGLDSERVFAGIWKNYLNSIFLYTSDLKIGAMSGAATITPAINMDENADSVSGYFSTITKSTDKSELNEIFLSYLTNLKKSLDFIAVRNVSDFYNSQTNAQAKISEFSDKIADDIFQNSPNSFR